MLSYMLCVFSWLDHVSHKKAELEGEPGGSMKGRDLWGAAVCRHWAKLELVCNIPKNLFRCPPVWLLMH